MSPGLGRIGATGGPSRAKGRQGPIPEELGGEVLPYRPLDRPVRSRRRSRESDIMPSSTKFSQTRYCVPGLRRVGGSAPARRAGARPLTPALRHTTNYVAVANWCLLPSASAPTPPRRHGQPLASLGEPTPSPPPPPCGRRRRAHARTWFFARAARRRAAPTARRRPPPRALAARRSVGRGAARGRPRRARRPRAPARESGRHRACGAAVETNLVTFTSAIGGVRNALAPPHRVRTSRRARRALASTR